MKTILSILLIAISASAHGQKEIPLYWYDTSKPRFFVFAHELTDTVPVVMLVSDTATGITQMKFGYSVCDRSVLSRCRYLNTEKQPLPERFVVWMDIRRKPDPIN